MNKETTKHYVPHYGILQHSFEVSLLKIFKKNLLKFLDLITSFQEMQIVWDHVKQHHEDVMSKIQNVMSFKRQTI